MLGLSAQHILLLLVIALLLFGKGKISELMGDVAKGIKSFKKGMADDEDVAKSVPPRTIDNDVTPSNDRSKTG
ncbi:MAG: twin-arginine translocase TatA/TatE family subunit [Hyphomicrobium sp.]